MSRTRRTPRPWDYRWQTWLEYVEYLRRWCNLTARTPRWAYSPWKNHDLSWGAIRRLELRIATRTLRSRTHAVLHRQVDFRRCTRNLPCSGPAHCTASSPMTPPDWHPGVVRAGYFD